MKLFHCLQQTRLAACLRDLLNSRSFVGEAEKVIKEFLSDCPYSGLLWLIHKLTLLNNQTVYMYSNSIYCFFNSTVGFSILFNQYQQGCPTLASFFFME